MPFNKEDLENLVGEIDYWQGQGQFLASNQWSSDQRQNISRKLFRGNPANLNGMTPDGIDNCIKTHLGQRKTETINYTAQNVEEILNSAKEDSLFESSLQLNKDYRKMTSALKNNDKEEMLKCIKKDLFEDKANLMGAFMYFASINEKLVEKVYAQEADYKMKKFQVSLSDETVEGEKKSYALSKDKINSYIKTEIVPANTATKNDFYLALAKAYTSEE